MLKKKKLNKNRVKFFKSNKSTNIILYSIYYQLLFGKTPCQIYDVKYTYFEEFHGKLSLW